LFIEYCKLKRLHKFYLAYKELGDEGIGYFVKLYKLAKKEGYSREQVVKILQLVDENNALGLSQLEKLLKWRIDEIHESDIQIERSKKHLYSVNDEIASAKALLNSYHTLCERKRQELKNINSEASRIVTLVNRFKNNNEEYLKIEKTVEEKVKSVLTDNKQILQFALASVIEAIRRNPDRYNSLLGYDTSLSSTSTSIPVQYSLLSHIED
jgi:DNA repair ATPase RecN